MLTYALFVIGFVILIKGADWLVDGSRMIAQRLGISELIIGITIVSWGTSMPEFFVSLFAGLEGSPNLAIGNVLGSNIANILLIMGFTAILIELPIHRNTVLSEIPFSLAAALLVGFLANTSFLHGESSDLLITRIDGIIILFFFFLFMVYVFKVAKEDKDLMSTTAQTVEFEPVWKAVMWVVVGCIGLYFGGDWVVNGATKFAISVGMSETVVGLTIVAIGTSLPELVTSMRAALKKNTDIAVGNIIGSNIFNLLWILGIASLVTPLGFDKSSNFDILVVILASSLVILSLVIGRRMVIKKWAGYLYLATYFLYITWLIVMR